MSKSSRGRIYCWDTSVFIAWFKEEQGKPLADIGLIVDEIDKKEACLLVSAAVYVEVQKGKFDTSQWNQYRDFLRRSNVIRADLTFAIADRARQLRELHLQRPLKVMDAIILATACAHQTDVIHSFDPDFLQFEGNLPPGLPSVSVPVPYSRHRGLLPNGPSQRTKGK